MIAFEVVMLIMICAVIIVAIRSIASPIAQAFSLKLKNHYQELGPDSERKFNARITSLEQEVRDLKQQLIGIQETTDFAVKLIESQKSKVPESKKSN
jgi:hypothetical protein